MFVSTYIIINVRNNPRLNTNTLAITNGSDSESLSFIVVSPLLLLLFAFMLIYVAGSMPGCQTILFNSQTRMVDALFIGMDTLGSDSILYDCVFVGINCIITGQLFCNDNAYL